MYAHLKIERVGGCGIATDVEYTSSSRVFCAFRDSDKCIYKKSTNNSPSNLTQNSGHETSRASIHKRIPTRLTLNALAFPLSYQRTHLLSSLEVYRPPAALGRSRLHLIVA